MGLGHGQFAGKVSIWTKASICCRHLLAVYTQCKVIDSLYNSPLASQYSGTGFGGQSTWSSWLQIQRVVSNLVEAGHACDLTRVFSGTGPLPLR